MTWFKVDDGLWGHQKWLRTPPGARALWVTAGSWSSFNLSDGHIPKHVLPILAGRPKDAADLVRVGLWRADEEDGWHFHQWNEDGRQPTREQVESDRAAARERMRKRREERLNKASSSDGVQANNDGTSGGVREPRPDPTRPGPPLEDLGSPQSQNLSLVTQSENSSNTPATRGVVRWTAKCREFGFSPVGNQTTVVGNEIRELIAEGNPEDLVMVAVDLAGCEGSPWINNKMGAAVAAQRKSAASSVSESDPVWGGTLGKAG